MASSSTAASGPTDVDDVIAKLLEVRGSRPGKQVNLTEAEIRGLCTGAREVFMNQPVLLELEAPIKICGARRTSLRSRETGRSALLTPCWRHTLLPLAYLCWHTLTAAPCCALQATCMGSTSTCLGCSVSIRTSCVFGSVRCSVVRCGAGYAQWRIFP